MTEFVTALANERRRYVLYYLRDVESAEFDDVVERVATWETGSAPEALDERTRNTIRIDLQHAQLPKLEEAGLIGHDRRHGSVCFQHLSDSLEQLLEYCATVELSETPD